MRERENKFQRNLIKEIKMIFGKNDCMVLKNDASYIQGIPDLLILYKDKWAALECKRTPKSNRQPNQPYYVDKMNRMSYCKFICPENKEEVLNELQQALRPRRTARTVQRKPKLVA